MHWLDPDHLPEIAGALERLLANPHGEVDGLLLADGTEVLVPPHLSGGVRAALRPCGAVRVRGVRIRGVPDFFAAVALECAGGVRVVDNGLPKDDAAREATRHAAKARRRPGEAAGVVARPLHGPKGEVRGALLEDGTLVRLSKHTAAAQVACCGPARPWWRAACSWTPSSAPCWRPRGSVPIATF